MVDYQVVCYENEWVLKEIVRAVDKHSNKLTKTSEVESRIMKYVGKYIATQDKLAKNRRYIIKLIYTKLSQSLNGGHYKREQTEFFSDIGYTDDYGETLEYEPQDTLASVETDLEIKETITLLAKDDRRRELILTEWANGCTNDTELSETLASFLGGQSRSHRIFIQRFRIECQANYYAMAI